MAIAPRVRISAIRHFLHSQSSAGLVLMGTAAVALVIANSPLASAYEAVLHLYLGPLSVAHWINDALMAVFFLLVGLEIKREMLDGQLSTWSRRILPGIAAVGGMAVPALLFFAFNTGATARGWAIPAATDIAFALGVISLLGNRVPASMRIFLAALAIIDDLGAVIIIALFYTADLSVIDPCLRGGRGGGLRGAQPPAGAQPDALPSAGRAAVDIRVSLRHPRDARRGRAGTDDPDGEDARRSDVDANSPLHRLEHFLHLPVGFLIVPLFALANAGVSVLQLPAEALAAPVTLGVALGLLLGKPIGVFGMSALAIRFGRADAPAHASRLQMFGVALLCGIGFTMSLFIALLAFPADPILQSEAKIGILAGSLISGLLGYAVLRLADREKSKAAANAW